MSWEGPLCVVSRSGFKRPCREVCMGVSIDNKVSFEADWWAIQIWYKAIGEWIGFYVTIYTM